MTFVAQYYGAQRTEMIGPAIWQSIFLSIIGGLLFLLLIPASAPLFNFIDHSANLKPLEIEYFISLTYSAMPAAIVAATSGFFTGLGRSQTVMWINGVGLIANAFLDYALIFGNWGFPALGIAGAGYATALANWASAFYGLYLVWREDRNNAYHFRTNWKWNVDIMSRYIRYGLPSGMQWALEGLAFTVFLIFVGKMANGDAALAASGIAVTIMMLSVLPAMGVAQAVSVLVGQHLGEKKPELAERDTWSGLQVAAMYIVFVGISFVLFPEFYMNWFRNEKNLALWSSVSTIVPFILCYVAFFTCFDSMNLVFSFALKGAGDTRFVTLVALTMPWPLMVLPTALIKDHDSAIYLAWGAATVYIVLQAMVFLRRFTGGKWKSMSVIN
jgi:multidrug resistance protein, MATE family